MGENAKKNWEWHNTVVGKGCLKLIHPKPIDKLITILILILIFFIFKVMPRLELLDRRQLEKSRA
jgi:hypothetical protein